MTDAGDASADAAIEAAAMSDKNLYFFIESPPFITAFEAAPLY
jgi:hypothetical protein